MDVASAIDVTFEFEGASVLPVREDVARGRPYRIGWLIKSVEVDSASIRYRCFHFARVLAPRFESIYFTSGYDLLKRISDVDAIVIVKRIDSAVMDIVAKARLYQVPVFMDFCDDMLAPGYVKNEFGVNLMRFLGVAPFLAGVTVPSAEMADRIEGYARANGVSGLKVHNIPDIAETWDIYRATYQFVTGWTLPASLPSPTSSVTPGRKRIVWFGNYGASHSNFGIYTLRPALKSLYVVNEDVPLELIVVSNSEPVYRALVQGCGFPTRYVPWSAPAVYAELAAADAALLTTGDDDFCHIKSSTRVLQAFAAGVPVLAGKGSAVAEFDESIPTGKMKDALRACIGPERERLIPARLKEAERVLARYRPQRVGKLWEGLLTNAMAEAKAKPGARQGEKLLIVLEPGNNLRAVTKLVKALRPYETLDYELLVSTQLLEADPRYWNVLRSSRVIPRFFSGKPKGVRNLLGDCSAIIVERPNAPIARIFRHHAAQFGVPVLTNAEAVYGGLSGFVKTPSEPGPSPIRAGPYPERLNDDGSVDWAFLVHEKSRGWILDAICREIGSRQESSWKVVYYPDTGPAAKNYFFSHHSLFETFSARQGDKLKDARVFVWYTHPRIETPSSVAKLLLAFDKATKVIFTCESNRQVWLDRGLPEDKTVVILGAADPALFQYHERTGNGVVGLSSAFYERKNPDVLLEVIRQLPHRQFVLLGRNWNQYALFEEMRAQPNFTYLTAPYRDYGKIYSTFDVFLSISRLEGGPIPLVEAMMSNAVPVASRTGFAPELIRHGQNGFLFDTGSPEAIAELIEAAYDLTGNVRQTVEGLTWTNLSDSIVKLAA